MFCVVLWFFVEALRGLVQPHFIGLELNDGDSLGCFFRMASSAIFWMVVPLVTVTAMLPGVVFRVRAVDASCIVRR